MTTRNTRQSLGVFAVFMIACGVFAFATSVLSILDARPVLYNSSSVVQPADTSHASLDPKGNEWPLIIATQFQTGRPPESYSIEVAGWRNTDLIQLTASSGSPEEARALASWLGDSFVTSLRDSYASRGLSFADQARVRERPESLPSLSRWKAVQLVMQFVIPSLLVLGGTILLRVRQ